MKFVSYQTAHFAPLRPGWILSDRWVVDMELSLYWGREEGIVDISPTIFPKTMYQVLQRWDLWLPVIRTIDTLMRERMANWGAQAEPGEQAHQFLGPLLHSADTVHLGPPVQPSTFRDFYAFEEHVRNARARRGLDVVPEWYEFPVFYFSNPNALLGPGEPVRRPPYTTMLDYELETACVLGKGGIDVSPEEAESMIAGYMILNDWSARDVQRAEMKVGLGPAKGKDFATSLGPWLVTPDELEPYRIGDRYDLEMTATVNGEVYSKGNLKDIYFTFPQMISRASQGVRLEPGELIGSGTVGSGCILELGPETHPWLQVGDTVMLTITGLGSLSNTVVE
ncbi:fumarylacetoacetate hydrolase family protein [Kyrpidia sp.]|uniref:fumarylacetoacetate hydrolase family protein n=1 Tax=Kyrpidia sp. TaxID=2073077 RepID=UPI00258B9C1C|nr:fumarylacetoacetate hydrolase family protein [Kyrpidia sp.]